MGVCWPQGSFWQDIDVARLHGAESKARVRWALEQHAEREVEPAEPTQPAARQVARPAEAGQQRRPAAALVRTARGHPSRGPKVLEQVHDQQPECQKEEEPVVPQAEEIAPKGTELRSDLDSGHDVPTGSPGRLNPQRQELAAIQEELVRAIPGQQDLPKLHRTRANHKRYNKLESEQHGHDGHQAPPAEQNTRHLADGAQELQERDSGFIPGGQDHERRRCGRDGANDAAAEQAHESVHQRSNH